MKTKLCIRKVHAKLKDIKKIVILPTYLSKGYCLKINYVYK